MNKGIIISVLTLVIVISGVYYILKQNSTTTSSPSESIMKEEKKDIENSKDGQLIKSDYQGKIIAGKTAAYLEFNKNDYDKALREGKIIFLDFYANWCPICRAEAPEIEAGFNEFINEPNATSIIGFRVNYNDSETDNDEEELAEKFKIPYQHTKVILKEGQEISRSGDSWDKNTLLEELYQASDL